MASANFIKTYRASEEEEMFLRYMKGKGIDASSIFRNAITAKMRREKWKIKSQDQDLVKSLKVLKTMRG